MFRVLLYDLTGSEIDDEHVPFGLRSLIYSNYNQHNSTQPGCSPASRQSTLRNQPVPRLSSPAPW